jgi:hypothetical protein
MRFGIAVGKLVGNTISSLQSVGDARSEYQEFFREFEALDAALRHLDRLEHTCATTATVASIKCAALSCQHPLEEFRGKVRNFEEGLGPHGDKTKWAAITSTLEWSFGHKDDTRRLQTYLNVYIGTINILIAEHNLEFISIAEKTFQAHSSQVRDQFNAIQGDLECLRQRVSAQAFAMNNV